MVATDESGQKIRVGAMAIKWSASVSILFPAGADTVSFVAKTFEFVGVLKSISVDAIS
jgi:hypothetical protein